LQDRHFLKTIILASGDVLGRWYT